MNDLRLSPRLPVHLSVRYEDGAELAASFIRSLSRGGVFIRTSRPLPIGTDLVMEIHLDAEPIRVRGRVVWGRLAGRDDGMGVAFQEELPERLKNLLTAKVA